MNSKLILISILLLSLFACNNTSETENKQVLQENKDPKDTTLVLNEEQKKDISNLELLQGKWQNTDDETSFLKFEKDHKLEIAGGMTDWIDEVFVLSDKCINESDKNKDVKAEEDRYITSPSSDMCWYIIDLDEEILTLAYMARGNTLAYKRVK